MPATRNKMPRRRERPVNSNSSRILHLAARDRHLILVRVPAAVRAVPTEREHPAAAATRPTVAAELTVAVEAAEAPTGSESDTRRLHGNDGIAGLSRRCPTINSV